MIFSDKFKNKYRIPSTRLSCHDYNDGVYFITICTKNREHYFGEISNDEMHMSKIGKYAEEGIRMTEEIHNDVTVPLFQIMPNHIHMIITVETPYYDVSPTNNRVIFLCLQAVPYYFFTRNAPRQKSLDVSRS